MPKIRQLELGELVYPLVKGGHSVVFSGNFELDELKVPWHISLARGNVDYVPITLPSEDVAHHSSKDNTPSEVTDTSVPSSPKVDVVDVSASSPASLRLDLKSSRDQQCKASQLSEKKSSPSDTPLSGSGKQKHKKTKIRNGKYQTP